MATASKVDSFWQPSACLPCKRLRPNSNCSRPLLQAGSCCIVLVCCCLIVFRFRQRSIPCILHSMCSPCILHSMCSPCFDCCHINVIYFLYLPCACAVTLTWLVYLHCLQLRSRRPTPFCVVMSHIDVVIQPLGLLSTLWCAGHFLTGTQVTSMWGNICATHASPRLAELWCLSSVVLPMY